MDGWMEGGREGEEGRERFIERPTSWQETNTMYKCTLHWSVAKFVYHSSRAGFIPSNDLPTYEPPRDCILQLIGLEPLQRPPYI